jgi:hypothetical protein
VWFVWGRVIFGELVDDDGIGVSRRDWYTTRCTHVRPLTSLDTDKDLLVLDYIDVYMFTPAAQIMAMEGPPALEAMWH